MNVKDLFDLSGRTAIVTGGSRGLGQEMAEGLAEAGAEVMICARRAEWLDETLQEFQTRNFKGEGSLCDVSNERDVQAVVEETIKIFGKADISINTAGISRGTMPEEMPLDKWQKILDVNLTGAFLFAQIAGREMLKKEYGRIINIASTAGFVSFVNDLHYAGYAASKAVLMGLIRELAAS